VGGVVNHSGEQQQGLEESLDGEVQWETIATSINEKVRR